MSGTSGHFHRNQLAEFAARGGKWRGLDQLGIAAVEVLELPTAAFNVYGGRLKGLLLN